MIEQFAERIRSAAASGSALRLRGGGTKDFYGQTLQGEILDTRGCSGVVDYEPTELFITARCGTPLVELEAALAEKGQMLAFEPPHFGTGATLGGCIAAGLSGPRRATAGGVRDFVLGVKIMDGRGEVQSFGGQVMKNVAGYDISRLMAGSLGTLGLLLEASLKVLPIPSAEATLRFEMPQDRALEIMNHWAGRPFPISATCWWRGAGSGELVVRLSGAKAAVASARQALGGELLDDGAAVWRELREQRHAFFGGALPLWRACVPSTASPLQLPGDQLIEWSGSQRWCRTNAPSGQTREVVVAAGGHATLFRSDGEEARHAAGVFHPLAPAMLAVQRRLKLAFDPHGIMNPGRMYANL